MQAFRDLLVWQKAYDLSMRIEDVCDRIAMRNPKLAKQLVEAAASIPAAISEGRGRRTDADFAHFLSMAIGSANETENHLQRAFDRNLISDIEHRSFTDDVIEVRKMLIGLRKTLQKKRRD